jgi:hypothetical protein
MVSIYILINRFLDVLTNPLQGLHPMAAMTVWSVILGVVAMLIYKYTSKQDGIKDAKERIKGHFYEVWLYIDDAAVIMLAQGRIFFNAGRYLVYALPPLAIMIVLFFPLFANFETRYAMRPVEPGTDVLVKVRLDKYSDGWQDKVKLVLPEGVQMKGYPVRLLRKVSDDEKGTRIKRRDYEVNYKLMPKSEGAHLLKFESGGKTFEVPLYSGFAADVGERMDNLATTSLGAALLYPPAIAIPAGSGIERIEIQYPEADFPFLGWNTWWIWPMLIISMVAALAVKGVFKVEI